MLEVARSRAGAAARSAVLACDSAILSAAVIAAAAQTGVTRVVQPGGSAADEAVIAEADRAGMAMVLTGVSHLRYG